MSQNPTVFFSWQSDIRAAATKTLIQDALDAAADLVATDGELQVEPVIDRDTAGVGGSPHIRDTILGKIDAASVYVADVTLIGKVGPKERLTPNPNVVLELGYAVKSLTWDRIILVMNTEFGGPDELPFDLRGHRTLTFASATDAAERKTERRQLQKALFNALIEILKTPKAVPRYPAELTYRVQKENSHEGRQDYILHASLTNKGHSSFTNWNFTVAVPRLAVRPEITMHSNMVASEGTPDTALFRFTPSDSPSNKTLYPGATETRPIELHMTSPLLFSHKLHGSVVVMKGYMDNELVAEVEVPFESVCDY